MSMVQKARALSFILLCWTIQPVWADPSPAQKMILRITECFRGQVNATGAEFGQDIANCFSVSSTDELDWLTSSDVSREQDRQGYVMILAPFVNVVLWCCYFVVVFGMDKKGLIDLEEKR